MIGFILPITNPILKSSQTFVIFEKESNFKTFTTIKPIKRFTGLVVYDNKIDYIILGMPEGFVNDEKRPDFLSLPILQRIGKLEIMEKKERNEPKKKLSRSEINHEFRFSSLKQEIFNYRRPLFISLGLKREDELLKTQIVIENEIKPKNQYNFQKKKKIQEELGKQTSKKIIFSIVSVRKVTYLQKFLISFFLLLVSLLSLF